MRRPVKISVRATNEQFLEEVTLISRSPERESLRISCMTFLCEIEAAKIRFP